MNTNPYYKSRKAALALVLMLGAIAWISNATAAINAQLSRSQTSVGMPVQLLIEVDGSTNVVLPQSIPVDGLQIERTGQQTRVEIINFRMKTSAVYSYTIYPNQEGVFEIPSIDVTVDGKREKTPVLELRVDAGASGVPVQRAIPLTSGASGQGYPHSQVTSPQSDAPDGSERLAFAELIMPRESAFVGEMVPVEVRFYFNQAYQFEIQGQRPNLSGEGFTVQRLSDPQRGEQRVGNANYHVFSFQTAITPLKSGQIEIPSVTLDCITRVPMSSMGSIDDIFEQFFGGAGFPGMGQARQMTIASEPTQLTVKPLPKEGRPQNFSGAVGEFSISSSASPPEVGPGEPLTLSVNVSGRGNFDSMGDPVLLNDAGWQKYPPTQKFDPNDPIGLSGRKQFDFMLVARENQTTTPGAEFNFFDPLKEEYVIVTADPVAVVASAGANTSTIAADVTSKPTPNQTPATDSVTPAEVAGPPVMRGFSPWIRTGGAWVFNALVALVVFGFIVGGLLKRKNSTEAGVKARRKRERQGLMATAGRVAEGSAFADAVVAVLQFDAETTGQSGAWGRVDALADVPEYAESAARLREVLASVDESRFSGGMQANQTQSTMTKAEILAILKKVQP